eukprot:Pgem_evm1s7317
MFVFLNWNRYQNLVFNLSSSVSLHGSIRDIIYTTEHDLSLNEIISAPCSNFTTLQSVLTLGRSVAMLSSINWSSLLFFRSKHLVYLPVFLRKRMVYSLVAVTWCAMIPLFVCLVTG